MTKQYKAVRTYKWPPGVVCGICGKTDVKYHSKGLCDNCRARKWNSEHREKCRETRRKSFLKTRIEVLDHYGNSCVCCGEKEPNFLSIDHINNDGHLHRKTVKSHAFYTWIRLNNFPNDLQILCYNCNMAKGKYGICPHKLK